MNFSVSEKDLKKYLFKFFGSLERYPDRYLPLFSEYYDKAPKHLAYLCPLCIKNVFYTEDKLWHYTENFSLDHFPPKNVGGTNKMLVCKKCNNTAGYSYENSFLERVVREGYNRKVPNIEVPAVTNMEKVKGWLPSTVSIAEDGSIAFKVIEKAIKRIPELTGQEKESNNGGDGFKMNIVVEDIDKKKVTKALLKTAYLYCFDYWGYEFVFSSVGELFRNVLEDKCDYPIATPTLWYDNKAEIHKGIDIPTGMVFIQRPKEIMSMFVNIPVFIKKSNYKCVIPIQIPHPEDKEFKDIVRVQNFFYDNPSQEILTKPISFEFQMAFPNPYSKTWEELKKLDDNLS